MIVLISVSVLILSVILSIFALVVFWKRGKTIQTAKTNYRVFFIMGIFMVPIGVSWMIVSFLINYSYPVGFPFFILGVVYLVIGLSNRGNWKKR